MSYGQLNAIKDAATRQLVQALFDQVRALQGEIAALQANALLRGSPVPVAARLTDVYDPEAPTDAVNVQFMRRYVQAARTGSSYVPPVAPGESAGGGGIPGTPNVPPSDGVALVNGLATVQAVFAANPGYVATSCQSAPGGTWDLMDAIVDALRALDTRFAYNGKRGNASDPSHDAVSFDYGTVPGGEGSTSVYIVDVIAGHCGPTPGPAWQDVTVFAPGVWISRGRF